MKKYILPVLASFLVVTFGYAVNITGTPQEIREFFSQNLGGVSNTTDLSPVTADLTDGTQKTQIVDGSGNVIASTNNNLHTYPTDPMAEIALGNVSGKTHNNKYGRAIDGVQTTPTDIWDRSDASPTQQLWIAPTTARVHTITSSSGVDDGTPEGDGVGAQAVRVWGLKTWDLAETSEDVVLNGTANATTSNSYVIIHRMKIIPVGTTYATNTGNITATAVSDGTVTAQISAMQGQTLMAIMGIPSIQTGLMTGYEVSSHNTGNPSTVVETDFTMFINERPDLNVGVFINKSNVGLIAAGSSVFPKDYKPYLNIPGPAIIKFQAISTLADTEGVAEFDIILVDN